MPLISVIVPVYNTENYLRRCINSILDQTFTDLELILVDDGSTDCSGTICDEYAEKDSRVKVCHKANGGVSSARNAGLALISGEYLTFVDSDDWLSIECFEKMISAIREYGAELCICRIKRVNEQEDFEENHCSIESVESGYEALNKVAREDGDRYRCCPAKLVKTSIASRFFFPVGRRWSEDTAVVYLWYHSAETVVFLDYHPYYYFMNSDSASHTRDLSIEFDEIDTWHEQLNLYAKEYKELYYDRLDAYKNVLLRWLPQIDRLNQYEAARKRILKDLRRVLWILATHQHGYIKNHVWCYEIAFPHMLFLYWTGIGISKKIKKVFQSRGKE